MRKILYISLLAITFCLLASQHPEDMNFYKRCATTIYRDQVEALISLMKNQHQNSSRIKGALEWCEAQYKIINTFVKQQNQDNIPPEITSYLDNAQKTITQAKSYLDLFKTRPTNN